MSEVGGDAQCIIPCLALSLQLCNIFLPHFAATKSNVAVQAGVTVVFILLVIVLGVTIVVTAMYFWRRYATSELKIEMTL